ncbi:DUF4142 domain-containing protein [Chelatococcus reniformis]|uniref:DUF4142 domain-containing protein n=1 Tax=Chelatococcus reniformis TaxID=1494448 RepID=A0A916UYA7_9HYPH|nr:DUF4142 domain-containing protein [Chelatococcus reniformis]GGC93736.1 hypothetical protein GCM10010994_59410 [Chelatococcus reniformis]
MQRRALILAAAGVLPIVSVAYAAPPTASPIGSMEEKHVRDTLATGKLALETSRIALQKAQHAWVKKFAQFEVAEQETLADVLRVASPAATSAPPAGQPDEVGELAKYSGAEFDAAYIRLQLDGHNNLLAIQEEYIKSGKNPSHAGIAKLARGQIKEHIELLNTIRQQGKG